tara:strand:- start:18372 stop:18719 length:348 start_codon:yes stop_codon:yes gene_type:complete
MRIENWTDPKKGTFRWFYYKLRSRFHKFYRAYLWNIDRNKLKKNLFFRKEMESPTCLECGECCKDCPVKNPNNNECRIWKNISIVRCESWPITPWDLKLSNLVNKCRFYWEDMRY